MEEDKQIIIPTSSKAKISHLLSFPIGAEKISKALANAPQIASLVLHFYPDRWGQVRYGRYALIRVSHSSRYAEMDDQYVDSAGMRLFNEWEVNVSPVPRVHRHNIQQHIIDVALPQINEWLHQRSDLKQPTEESLTFYFDEQKNEFTSEVQAKLLPQRA